MGVASAREIGCARTSLVVTTTLAGVTHVTFVTLPNQTVPAVTVAANMVSH